jgi:hypothetical protein
MELIHTYISDFGQEEQKWQVYRRQLVELA